MSIKPTRFNQDGLTHILYFAVMLAVVVAVGYVGVRRIQHSSADTVGDFSYLATHPQAAAQPTAMGKTILTLKPYNGKLYAGFGDYGSNTGPIAITPFDPTSGSFAAAPSLLDGTEQVDLYRVINSKLYAASVDPHDASNPSYDAVGSTGDTWLQNSTKQTGAPLEQHVFDINTLNGTDLWAAGSNGNDAVVWHSTDGGTTWTQSLDVAVTGDAERFYAIGAYNGKLYVQASQTDSANTVAYPMEAKSHVFAGSGWTSGPNLGSGSYFWHPDVFAGMMVYLNFCACNGAGAGTMYALNSSNAVQAVATPASIDDFAIDGSTLYALASNGSVYSTPDLTTWYLQRSGPTTARSMAVLNGKLYVGTTDSKLYVADVNPAPTAVGGGTTSGGTKHGGGSGGTTSGGGNHKK